MEKEEFNNIIQSLITIETYLESGDINMAIKKSKLTRARLLIDRQSKPKVKLSCLCYGKCDCQEKVKTIIGVMLRELKDEINNKK